MRAPGAAGGGRDCHGPARLRHVGGGGGLRRRIRCGYGEDLARLGVTFVLVLMLGIVLVFVSMLSAACAFVSILGALPVNMLSAACAFVSILGAAL